MTPAAQVATGIYQDPNLVRETDKAVLIRVVRPGGIHIRNGVDVDRASEVWLPKSKIEWRADQYGNQLFVPSWLMRKLG